MMLAIAKPVTSSGVHGEQQHLADAECARRDDGVDRQQASAVLVGRQIVEPRFGDDVLPGQAQPGHESQPRPRRRRLGETDREHGCGQQRCQRGVHADVADASEREEGDA